ncbi:hydantoinase/oxoprolinase family protein [soil metagenome]
MIRIGVDTGGTFTDIVALDHAGISVHKVPSTPADPSLAILRGIEELAGRPDRFDVVHGSTVATNAVLERKGARVALLATHGFEDVLRIGRQTRKELYNLNVEDRRPLVDAALTFGVHERIAADGSVLIPLQREEIELLATRLTADRVVAVAVCFLHSYRNSRHEEIAEEVLRQAGLVVSASHRVVREYREFERWSTTTVNAYVTPLMACYLSALEARLDSSRLSVMQSNGGSISAATAKAAAIRTILSGPAAGVVGARAVARAAGFAWIVNFEMGGTSTDVSLVDGSIGMTAESSVGDIPVRLPVIDIHTVGAGGGSIGYVDSGGALRVGPRSAGAEPGPACYGNGTELTVTDANLLLGRLDQKFFLRGRMHLDAERARSVARKVAVRMNVTETELAEGLVRIANASMERAIRVVSVERGFDVREFVLVAFGGAGGMHACEIASTLEMRTVVVPRFAGVLSALGMLVADVTRDYSQTVLRRSDTMSAVALDELFAPLVDRATAELAAEGFAPSTVRIVRTVDVRYLGQSYEISVPLSAGYRDGFDQAHARLYGYCNAGRSTEVVNIRVAATGTTQKPELPRSPLRVNSSPRPLRVAPVRFDGRTVDTSFYRWDDLPPGSGGQGPAVIAGGEATAVVTPEFDFHMDDFGNLVATMAVRETSGRVRAEGSHAPLAHHAHQGD